MRSVSEYIRDIYEGPPPKAATKLEAEALGCYMAEIQSQVVKRLGVPNLEAYTEKVGKNLAISLHIDDPVIRAVFQRAFRAGMLRH